MLPILSFLTAFFLTSALLVITQRGLQITCYPYLKEIKQIERKAIEDIKRNQFNPASVDRAVERLNGKILKMKSFLLDCNYCICRSKRH